MDTIQNGNGNHNKNIYIIQGSIYSAFLLKTLKHIVMPNIQMVDLFGQYSKIKEEIDNAIQNVINSSSYINGEEVKQFAQNLASYLNVKHVVPCGNGTDALQLALMALDLKEGDEVICPNFTFIASVEAVALLGLKPVLVDVDPHTFTIDTSQISESITPKTKAIIPVHLFGQCCNMDEINLIAATNNIAVIEDTAQALGAIYSSGELEGKAGTLSTIGCTSFFPSKNLGCFGDGGAVFTNDDLLAEKIGMLANHGAKQKYTHEIIGINSRLDTIQAAILNVKLACLDEYNKKRNIAAFAYDSLLSSIKEIEIPRRTVMSNHVFHQYTIKLKKGHNTELQAFLKDKGIPSMIYYPQGMDKQKAFAPYLMSELFPVSTALSKQVLSLPMHTELTKDEINYICSSIQDFFKKNHR